MKLTKHKFCWQATEHKKGWRLGLCIGEAKPKYIPFWFASEKDCDTALRKGLIVFVHLSTSGPGPSCTWSRGVEPKRRRKR